MKKIKVNLDKKLSSSHDICIGHDILDRMGLIIAKNHPASRYIVITDSNVSALHGESLLNKLKGIGLSADMIEFPAGEASKNISTVLGVVERMLKIGADRNSTLLALGGGVVGDITGMIASLYMRSIPYIQIPTTLMAQVDSSIGGKTAIDLPEGKNLLGTFHQPRGIFIDLKLLETLSDNEFNNGLMEVIKYGIIEDAGFFRFLEENMGRIRKRHDDVLEKIVESSCKIKKGIVEIDEKEQGLRRVLNFGHTIGHALEAASGYGISHGEAVAMGTVTAVKISERLHDLPAEDVVRIEHLIKAAGLPGRIPQAVATEEILARLKMDKKKRGDTVHFVLLKKIGMPFINGGVQEQALRDAVEEMKR
ncbi:MAG: 3-dehydroquinate synthase [Deltaproteobacteria bacterium]